MTPYREDSPPARTQSNRAAGLVDLLLELALETSGAERAFVVLDDPGREPCVLALRCRRPDGHDGPSRTALRRALAASRPASCLDLDASFHRAGSVRALGLRSVLTAPVPRGGGGRAALVLDSRVCRAVADARILLRIEILGALVGRALSAERRCDAAARPAPSRAPAYRRMLDWVARIAPSSLPVLVEGESGAGKETVCRTLHEASTRAGGPFVALNCTALPETLADAELFGATRGAYTGAEADRPGLLRVACGGTLLLDEIGDMPLVVQAKLLRALQEGRVRPVGGTAEHPIDVRVVAATHRDLRAAVARGSFRDDLYWRIAVLRVHVPALRERLEDLPDLLAALAPRIAAETGMGPPRLSADALEALRLHSWPGNVRELHATLARAALRTAGGPIETAHLDFERAAPARRPGGEREMIARALEDEAGSIAAAARRIGWTRQKLYRRIAVLGLDGSHA